MKLTTVFLGICLALGIGVAGPATAEEARQESSVGQRVKNDFKSAGKKIGKTAKETGHQIGKATKKTYKSIKNKIQSDVKQGHP